MKNKISLLDKKGLTLIEVMVVIVIIGILLSVVYFSVGHIRAKARFARLLSDMENVRVAIELYRQANDGKYPVNDNNGQVPPGLGPYLPNGTWPDAPWPGATYDWENVEDIDNPNLTNTYTAPEEPPGTINELDDDGIPGNNVIQISLKPNCASYDVGSCYVDEPFKSMFGGGGRSSIYLCIKGPCRSHPSFHRGSEDLYTGYCINKNMFTVYNDADQGICVI